MERLRVFVSRQPRFKTETSQNITSWLGNPRYKNWPTLSVFCAKSLGEVAGNLAKPRKWLTRSLHAKGKNMFWLIISSVSSMYIHFEQPAFGVYGGRLYHEVNIGYYLL